LITSPGLFAGALFFARHAAANGGNVKTAFFFSRDRRE
jgi:hypothetical protein